jgi:hypothetical protein
MDTQQNEDKSPHPGSFWEESGSLGHEAREGAGEAAQTLKEKAQGAAEAQKAAGADQLSSLSAAVHGAAGELAKEMPQAAGYVHSAADALQSASSALRERSIEDLVSAFNNFARKQPAAAFAGSVLAGFALGRFLKSSSA